MRLNAARLFCTVTTDNAYVASRPTIALDTDMSVSCKEGRVLHLFA